MSHRLFLVRPFLYEAVDTIWGVVVSKDFKIDVIDGGGVQLNIQMCRTDTKLASTTRSV